jgi:hypothetical protein
MSNVRLPGTGPSPKLTDEEAKPLVSPAGLVLPTTREMKGAVAKLPEDVGPSGAEGECTMANLTPEEMCKNTDALRAEFESCRRWCMGWLAGASQAVNDPADPEFSAGFAAGKLEWYEIVKREQRRRGLITKQGYIKPGFYL